MKQFGYALLMAALSLAGAPALVASVSQATMLFLKIAPGSRASGMGEAFVALADDATAVWWNPAGLGFQQKKQFTSMYARWLPQFNLSDLYFTYLAYVHNVAKLGTFGGSLTYLNLGKTERRDEHNRPLGTFSSYEMAVTGAYGTKVSENLTMGAALKIAYSSLSPYGAGAEKGTGTATAVAADIGLLYKASFLRSLSLGANLSNMGPKVAYIDRAQADPLPTNLKLGAACHIIDQEYGTLTVVTDVNKELVKRHSDGTSDECYEAIFTAWGDEHLVKTMIWNLGMEYWYGDHVGLRVGYWNDDLGKVFPTTFGVSVGYGPFLLDLSSLHAGTHHPLSGTTRFSLSLRDAAFPRKVPFFSINGGFAKQLGEGSEVWNSGFSVGLNVFPYLSGNTLIGYRVAYNRWTLSEDRGTLNILEFVPSARILDQGTRLASSHFFGQMGLGFFGWTSNAIEDLMGEPGLNLGVGFTLGNEGSLRFEILPLYHIILMEERTLKYFSVNAGIVL
jgi:hypothetical protein